MVRTYLPKTNLFGLDAKRFETYFGMKAEGAEEPGGGELPPHPFADVCVDLAWLRGASRPTVLALLWLCSHPSTLLSYPVLSLCYDHEWSAALVCCFLVVRAVPL